MAFLSQMQPGDQGVILGFHGGQCDYRQQLLAMGLTPGVAFTLVRMAPLGDPIEIRIRDFALCLRAEEAAILNVQRKDASCL